MYSITSSNATCDEHYGFYASCDSVPLTSRDDLITDGGFDDHTYDLYGDIGGEPSQADRGASARRRCASAAATSASSPPPTQRR